MKNVLKIFSSFYNSAVLFSKIEKIVFDYFN